LEALGGPAQGPAVLDHAAGQAQPSGLGQGCITVGHEGLSLRCRRRNPHRTGRPSPVQDPSAETWLTRPQPPGTEHLGHVRRRLAVPGGRVVHVSPGAPGVQAKRPEGFRARRRAGTVGRTVALGSSSHPTGPHTTGVHLGGDGNMALGTSTAAQAYELRFDTGRICLDLLATTHPVERLGSLEVLRAWITGSGLVPPGTSLAHADPSWPAALRELRGWLGPLVRSRPAPGSASCDRALSRGNELARAAAPAPCAVPGDDGALVRRLDGPPGLAALLAAVARDA